MDFFIFQKKRSRTLKTIAQIMISENIMIRRISTVHGFDRIRHGIVVIYIENTFKIKYIM